MSETVKRDAWRPVVDRAHGSQRSASRLGRVRNVINRDWGNVLVVTSALYLLGLLLWQVFRWGGAEHRVLLGNLIPLATHFAPIVLGFRVAMHARRTRIRVAWFLIAVASV